MRSRHIRIDPILLGSALDSYAGMTLEHRGLYFTLLLSCYAPFSDWGAQRRERIALDNLPLMRRFGDVRKVRRLLGDLSAAGLLREEEDGSLIPIHYNPSAWVRRAAEPVDYAMVAQRDGESCRRCGTTENLTVDHIIPVIAEGPDRLSNFQLLCRSCNSRKGGRVNG